MDQNLQILKAARAILRTGWCRTSLAIDGRGDPVDPHSENARAWCARGALLKVEAYHHGPICALLADEIPADSFVNLYPDPRDRVMIFNDSSTADAVLALFDKAIAKLEVRGIITRAQEFKSWLAKLEIKMPLPEVAIVSVARSDVGMKYLKAPSTATAFAYGALTDNATA